MAIAIRPYLLLSRPLNLLIAFLSICAATVLAGAERHDALNMVLAGLTGVFVAAGANAINDIFDIEIDRINRPDRPLPSGMLSRENAFRFWQGTALAAGVASAVIGPWTFLIAAGSIALLYYYSRSLKSMPLAGNVVVGGMTGMAFIFGGVAVGATDRALLPALFAFLVNLAREIVKDIEDRAGDSQHNASTFPIRFGVRPAQVITSASLIVLIAVTIYAYLLRHYDGPYLSIVLAADALLMYVAIAVWANDSPAHMRRLSNVLKATMVVGLAAIYFGSRG
jgi:geranylgeranylglycerol-phosphate geranylgeranyltransferase